MKKREFTEFTVRNVGTAVNVTSNDVKHALSRAEAELLGEHLRWLLSQDVNVKEFNVLIQGKPYVITRKSAYDMFIPLKRIFHL